MAADEEKIKYSDLVQPDNSIENLIKQLEDLNKNYETTINAIRAGAEKITHAIKSTSGAVKEGRQRIDEANQSVNRLKRAQDELKFAMSETGQKVAWLKSQTVDYNKATVEQKKYLQTVSTSYDRLKADLKQSVELYKSLTAEERANSEMGEKLLQDILNYKRQLAALDAQMKPHIQTLTQLEKAKQKLAYLQSEEGKELLKVRAQIQAEISARKEQKQVLTEIEKAALRLGAARSEENVLLKNITAQTREANRIAELTAQVNNNAEGSYNRLSAQYALNKIQLNKMSAEERSSTEAGKALEKQTAEIYKEMIRLQEATGNYRLSVGNYKKAWDGLGVAMSQVIREIPAAAVSINTFFLGISNNIPILIDEIQRLRAQNKLLAAEGKQQISITRQIISSIFSFNTIMIAGLTILAMHGDAIIAWAKEIISGRKAVMSLTEQLEAINDELENGTGSYGKNITEYKKLKKEWSDLSSLKEREEWLKKNEDAFRQLDIECMNVNDADRLFVDQTPEVLEAFKNRAKAAAAMELAQKKYQDAFVKQEQAMVEAKKEPDLADKLTNLATDPQTFIATFLFGKDVGSEIGKFRKVADLINESKVDESVADSYFKLAEGYQAASDAVLGNYEKTKKGRGRSRQPKDPTDYLDRTATDVQKKYMESITKLEKDELVKRRKETVETYNSEVASLNDKYNKITRILKNENNEYKKLTDEQKVQALATQDTIVKAIELKQQQLTQDLADIERDRQIQELQVLQQTLDLRLQAVKAGSEEELRLRLQSAEAQRRISILQNAKLPASQQVSEADINAGYKKSSALTIGSYEMSTFSEQQALQEAQYEAVWHNELSLTKFKLEQERERWQKQIELAKQGGLEWSQTQIDTAEATVKGIDRELSELNNIIYRIGEKGLVGGILEHLGFDDKQIESVNTVADEVVSALQEIAQAEVEAAQAAVEAAEERVEAAQSALDAELEARNNGYANSVEAARKELELEKKNQAQKERLLAEAQRRQERMNTISQASNLITASAGIWASFAPLGPLGIGLALAGIATMWASFAAAKIKANQLTQDTQEYGEGGLEFLEGGSHASGNDIDLGVSNSRKKRMKAEGGEALAIINKKQTSKYKRVLPDVIDSLNKGIFEDKYTKINSIGAETANVIVSNSIGPDLSKIEDTLEQIKNQGDTTSQVLPDGTIIETRKNIKRIVKR